ncbi:hypothetical protein BH23VER1_BH23VER1_36750 [soil metagenome]
MAKAQFKIVIFLLALSFLAASVFVAFYYVEKDYLPEKRAIKEIANYNAEPPPPPDPGAKMFDEAMALLGDGQIDAGRSTLLRLMTIYADSGRYHDARRIVGEINMDQLLSRRPMTGKLDYVVKRGDALAAIARNHRTSLEYIKLVNAIDGIRIHPGDRLVLFPLEFGIEIDLGANELVLTHQEKFFKAYRLQEYELPPTFRLPVQLKVGSKSAWIGEDRIPSTDERLSEAYKWIQCTRPGSAIGMVIAAGDAPEEQKKRLPSGIFVADKDMEELFTVVREGAIVSISK